MTKARMLKLAAVTVGSACMLLVLAAPLPGQVEGCSGEEENLDEVDYVQYCANKCTIKADKEVGECDIFGGQYTADEIFDLCYNSYLCGEAAQRSCSPRCDAATADLCPAGSFWKPYIAESEASRCLSALRRQQCGSLGEVPPECNQDELCDPL